ncbi:MAG TPA: hypothetical protein VKA67_09645 [Verrucomicrobiae bacterium]|nr:hypothetical protein [Verrucomicrobiae bacterium]
MPEENTTPPPEVHHRFLDETGDTTFYGKGRKLIIGQDGVSLTFGLGLVRIDCPLADVRREVQALQAQVEADPLLNTIPSVQKRIASGGFFFHACKDTPDVRAVLLRYLRELPCKADMVVARKIPALFVKQHNGREEEFYADLLAHLVKSRLKRAGTLVLNVAERGSSTREKVLTDALRLATERAAKKWGDENLKARAVFNVQNPRTEPLLTLSDYLCWAVQRVFETGEVRHYNYLSERIRLVVDLYDRDKYVGSRNYYDKKNPLTAGNKIGPPVT